MVLLHHGMAIFRQSVSRWQLAEMPDPYPSQCHTALQRAGQGRAAWTTKVAQEKLQGLTALPFSRRRPPAGMWMKQPGIKAFKLTY